MTRCLVVDDDLEIRTAVQQFLRGFGIDVSTAGDGREMRRLMASTARFDVVVLDLMLPDEDGLTLCRWVQQGPAVPVIMLTAQSDPISRIVGLEVGADDYIGKPFEPRELLARINAVLRREHRHEARATAAQTVAFEGWRFDRVRHRLHSPGGVLIELSNAEFRLLTALVERPGRVLTREQLIEATRAPGVDVNDRSIDLAVSRLRQKLGDAPKNPRLIRTLRGEGYLFDAQVETPAAGTALTSTPAAAVAPATPASNVRGRP